MGLPGGSVVKSTCQSKRHRLIPSPVTKIPYAAEQLTHNYWACALETRSHNCCDPGATTTEGCVGPMLYEEAAAMRSHQLQLESGPARLNCWEKPHNKAPAQPKIKKENHI